MRGAVANILHQSSHKLGPLIPGEFKRRDGSDDLGSGIASLGVGRRESLQGESLNAALSLLVGLLQPFGLQLLRPRELAGSERILQGETSSNSDLGFGVVVSQSLDEGSQVKGLERASILAFMIVVERWGGA